MSQEPSLGTMQTIYVTVYCQRSISEHSSRLFCLLQFDFHLLCMFIPQCRPGYDMACLELDYVLL